MLCELLENCKILRITVQLQIIALLLLQIIYLRGLTSTSPRLGHFIVICRCLLALMEYPSWSWTRLCPPMHWYFSAKPASLGVNNLFGAVWSRNGSDRRTSRIGYFVPPVQDKCKIRGHFSDNSYYLHRLANGAILLLLSRDLFFHWPTFHAGWVLQIILNLYKAQLIQVQSSSGRLDGSFWLDCFASGQSCLANSSKGKCQRNYGSKRWRRIFLPHFLRHEAPTQDTEAACNVAKEVDRKYAVSDGEEGIGNAVVIGLIPSTQGLCLSPEELRYIIVLFYQDGAPSTVGLGVETTA